MSNSAGTHPTHVREGGRRFVQSSAFEGLSRAGFVARGLIYGIIGLLALRLAIGEGGRTTNQQGALHTLADQPLGKLLLTLVAVGLGGYAIWRFVRAAIGHGPEGVDSGFDRVAAAASGVIYSALCVVAVHPLGPLLLGIVAVGLIAFAIYSFSDARYRRI